MTDAWLGWMTAMSLQAGALVVVALALDVALRRVAWPQLRHALWLLVAVKLVLPPTLSSPIAVAASVPEPAAASASGSAAPWLLAAWAGVALLLAAALVVRTIRARRDLGVPADAAARAALERAARRLGIGERRLPRLVVSRRATGPAVLGPWRPVVILPEDAPRGEELEHVLMHELAHVRRGDLWVQFAYGLLHAVYWFHPGVWLARRRAHAARELCCDATVAAALGEAGAPAYRRTLLRCAARRHGIALPGAAAFLRGGSTLLARVAALERGSGRRPGVRRAGAAALALVLAATLLPMAPAALPAAVPRAPTELEAAEAALDRVLANPGAYGSLEKQNAVRVYLALKNRR